MNKLVVYMLVGLLAATSAWARGGGGCFEQGTLIDTPSGPVPIEALWVGAPVLGIIDGQRQPAVVQAVMEVQPAEYLEISIGQTVLHVTAEHPFEIGRGVFRMADHLRVGDSLSAGTVSTIRHVAALHPAYNLLVSPGGTFLANGVVVHNKGCFLPDTPILRADGTSVNIQDVRSGDELLAFTPGGQLVHAKVRNVLTHQVDEYLEVVTEKTLLRVTVEHPFYVGDGTFKTLEALNVGDNVYAYDGQGLSAQKIISIAHIRARTRVYNLQTDEPNTFFANHIAVHNKGGGCFPSGTMIATPGGKVPIESVRAGDTVLTGQGGAAKVQATFVTRAPILTIVTSRGRLRTTAEHPLMCDDGRFRLAGDLHVGDGLSGTRIVRCMTGPEEIVYNLQVGAPHTFVADGFIVHNKGGGGFGGFGGGFHGGGGGGGNGDPTFPLIVMGVVVAIVVVKHFAESDDDGDTGSTTSADEDLDYIYKPAAVESKAAKTRKLLEFISKVDATFNEQALVQLATDTFMKLQQCWQARDYGPMQPLLMPDLYAEHCAELQGMRRDHEINKLDYLHVNRVEIVNVRYTQQENQREFTALITARAQDYYVDDRDGDFLRGDKDPAQFQEFWTFHRQNGAWLLREIEQTRESDKLKEDNFFEQFTDKAVQQVYGKTAGQSGPAGPWLEKAVETKATRIERMLNFLGQTDKLWDRQTMLDRARQVFTNVMSAREAGNPTAVSDDDLYPATALDLRQQIGKQRSAGLSVEYRNLCIRKVELILVRNFADKGEDEYTVRISAHAQRIIKQGGAIIQQDQYVTPFMEYWTFGRLDNQWKLKEVEPPAKGEAMVGQENVDEDSSAAQLQWYYKHDRAT